VALAGGCGGLAVPCQGQVPVSVSFVLGILWLPGADAGGSRLLAQRGLPSPQHRPIPARPRCASDEARRGSSKVSVDLQYEYL